MNLHDYLKPLNLRFFLFCILIFHFFIGISQNNNTVIQKADEYFQNQEFVKAIKNYNKVLVSDPDNYHINLQLARSYFKIEQYQNADNHYKKVLSFYEKNDPIVFLEYGELQMKMGQPEIARNYFMNYNNLMEKNDIQTFQYQSSIEFSDKYYEDSSFYLIKPIEFNSSANEQNPVLLNNKLLYETDQLFYSQDKVYNCIYFQNDDESESARPSIIEGKAPAKYIGKGFTVLPTAGELIISKIEINHHDSVYQLFSSKLDENLKIVSDQKPVLVDNFVGNINNPTVSADGNILIFSSDKGSYNRSNDLYIAYKSENGYSQPKPVQGLVNTLDNEVYPYFLNDSNLFFASNGHGGLGGLDMFYINLKSPNSLPVNIGYPLNSPFDETGICISHDGRYGYIASKRLGTGTNDLFRFELNRMRAMGLIVDEFTGKNLKDVLVDVRKDDGYTSMQTLADNGNFSIICQPGETYNVSISKEGYESKVFTVSIDNSSTFAGLNNIDIGVFSIKSDSAYSVKQDIKIAEAEPIVELHKEEVDKPVEKIDIQLPVVEDTSLIRFRVQIAASRRKMNSNELKSLYSGSKSISMFREESWYKYYIGEYNSFYEANSICRRCNVNGAFVVAYMGDRKLILKDAIRENHTNKTLQVTSEANEAEQLNLASVEIYYPYNEYQPIEKELNKLDKLVNMLSKNPDQYIEIIGYVDKQGNSYYNIGLSLERSKLIKNYLIKKSIDPSRIFLRSIRQMDINTKTLTKNGYENRKVEIIVFK